MGPDTFHSRLKEIQGDESARSFARRVGISEGAIRALHSGGKPTLDSLLSIATGANVELKWLATGEGPKIPSSQPTASDETSLVPRLDILASAGDGASGESGEPVEMIAFPRAWLRSAGVTPENARVLTVSGDSMEPTLSSADLLLVDTSVNRIGSAGIYVLVRDDEIYVKRAERRLNGSVLVSSDNPHYAPEEFASDDATQLRVAGRVAWFGRSI